MHNSILEILVCPACKGKLVIRTNEKTELICKIDRLAFPVRDDIPIMLIDEARKLPLEEVEDVR